MNSSAVALAITVLEALPALLKVGEDAIALINATAVSLRAMQSENRDPNDSEWEAVHQVIEELTRRLNADAPAED